MKLPFCKAKTNIKPEPLSNYLWILDNGHGGIIDGNIKHLGKDHQYGMMALSCLKANLIEQ